MQDLFRDSNSPQALPIECVGREGPLLKWAFCLSLSILAAFTCWAPAASEAVDPNQPGEAKTHEELSQRLEELIRQLRQERSAYYAQKAEYESRIQKARENRSILRGELEEMRRQQSEMDRQIQKYGAEVKDLEKQLESRSSLQKTINGHIEPFLVKQRTAIEKGIPYKQQERIDRLQAASADGNDVSAVSVADHLAQVWNYGQEELRLARSSETYSARAKAMEEATPHARYFRVGRKILGYLTEDGMQTAMWLSLPDESEWVFITDPQQSAQIRSAVAILDRRQGPRLVTLPIVLWPRSTVKEGVDGSP
jgi:hypothetical protein